MITPWTIHEAEIALYPAWRDGMPFRGPGTRADASPLLQCKSSLSISHTPRDLESSGFNWTGAESTADGVWEISASFPDGAFTDVLSRLKSRPSPGGFYILVIRFIDAVSGHWSCFRFFYVTAMADGVSEKSQIMERTLSLRSTWLQEDVGASSAPSLEPLVLGEVEWICGSQRVTALTYNPATLAWASLPRNEIGGGGSYVRVHGADDDITLSCYLPSLVTAAPVTDAPLRKNVQWGEGDVFHVGNSGSPTHYGLALGDGFSLQVLGIVEPLLRDYTGWDRGMDPVYVVFRYLRRIYAVLGDGVLAMPKITLAAPPASHDPAFQFRPANSGMGLVLLPQGGWLSGTVSA